MFISNGVVGWFGAAAISVIAVVMVVQLSVGVDRAVDVVNGREFS